MTAPRIQCDYDSLESLGQTLQGHADQTNRLLQTCHQGVAALQHGGWTGVGADNFYREMDESVLPAVQRLSAALSDAARATQAIAKLFSGAEDEAGALFRDGLGGAFATGVGGGTAADAVQPIGYVPGGGNAASLMWGIIGAEMALDVAGPMQNMLSSMGFSTLDAPVQDLRTQIEGMRTGLAMDMIDQIPGTSIEEWGALSPDQREAVLTKVHEAYAQAYGFEPVPIQMDDFGGHPNAKGMYDWGEEIHETHFEHGLPIQTSKDRTGDPTDDRILIHEDMLQKSHPEAIPYLIHESRHALQNRAAWNPTQYDYFPEDLSGAWKQNFYKYRSPTNADYAEQPVEADAYDTQDLFFRKLYGQS